MGKNLIDRGFEPVTVKIKVRRTEEIFTERVVAALKGDRIVAVGGEADFDLASGIFDCYLSKVCGPRRLFHRPRVAVCVPLELTQVERRAYEDVFYRAKARQVMVVEQAMEQAERDISAKYGVIVGIYPQLQDGR